VKIVIAKARCPGFNIWQLLSVFFFSYFQFSFRPVARVVFVVVVVVVIVIYILTHTVKEHVSCIHICGITT